MPLLTRIKRKLAAARPKPNSLRNVLIREGRTQWLDVGSVRFDDGFDCLNLVPIEDIPPEKRERYFYADLTKASEEEIAAIGQYDLVRLQHVFEHFGPEEGLVVLDKLARC